MPCGVPKPHSQKKVRRKPGLSKTSVNGALMALLDVLKPVMIMPKICKIPSEFLDLCSQGKSFGTEGYGRDFAEARDKRWGAAELE